MSSNSLSHLRVLDLSRVLAGPWCGQILADLGAEVIKVERPGAGDDTRAWGPPFLKDRDGKETKQGAYFLAANRGKKSITLDLSTEQGQAIVRKLALQSDILIENYKVGTLERYGLGYKELSALNPKLIYCSVTGFGQSGPLCEQPAYDFLIQALGGLMSVTGLPDGEPQKVGIPIVDLVTGIYSSVGILAAIASREKTGVGSHIDVAMLDVQVGLLSNQAMNYLVGGKTPMRTGNAHPNIQPQQVFSARDADFIIVVGNEGQFANLCNAIGMPELISDERFSSNAARVRNKDALVQMLALKFSEDDRATWISKIGKSGVPCGPINSIPEVFAEPQVQHRGILRNLPHPISETIPQVGSPLVFNGVRAMADIPPPGLGTDTETVLTGLGITLQEQGDLRAQGVI